MHTQVSLASVTTARCFAEVVCTRSDGIIACEYQQEHTCVGRDADNVVWAASATASLGMMFAANTVCAYTLGKALITAVAEHASELRCVKRLVRRARGCE
jgi:hypothetical protein